MSNPLELTSRDIYSINDFTNLYNENMEIINGMFNKFISVSNRQNRQIFWMNLGILALATSVYLMSSRLDRAQQQIDGLRDMVKAYKEADKTEEK